MNRYPFLAAATMFICVASSLGQAAQDTKPASNGGSTIADSYLRADSREGTEDWTALSIEKSGLDHLVDDSSSVWKVGASRVHQRSGSRAMAARRPDRPSMSSALMEWQSPR